MEESATLEGTDDIAAEILARMESKPQVEAAPEAEETEETLEQDDLFDEDGNIRSDSIDEPEAGDNAALEGEEIDLNEEKRLNEAVQGQLRQQDYTRKTQALADDKRAFEAERDNFSKQAGDKVQKLDAVIANLENSVSDAFSGVDWNTLKDEDPDRYLMLKEAQRDQKEKLTDAQAVRDTEIAQLQGQQSHLQEQWRATQREEFVNSVPDLKNASQEQVNQYGVRMATFLRDSELRPDEIAQIGDSRYMRIIDKAMRYDRLKAKSKEVKAKTKTLPKYTRPGAKSAKQTTNVEQYHKDVANIRADGNGVDDVAAILLKNKMV